MSVDINPTIETCPSCGSPIDASDLEPLSAILCPACGAEMTANRYLGDYELIEVMGRGGQGVVYRAMDTRLARQVALKVLRKEYSQQASFIAQLEAEAAITASINHPHVVKVYTTGTTNGRFYLAMELVDKGTLDDLLTLQGRVAEAQALEIMLQIAQGLRAANQHGLIHRDVKPGNILFSDAHTSKIVDFGLAIMQQASVGSNEIWGTPYYVPPERLDQKPEDFHSDMYSLGATIFHILAGRPPFEAENATMVALKHLKSQAVSLQAFAPWVSSSTSYVINKTLNKDPKDRYASYDEMIEHLEYARDQIAEHGGHTHEKQRIVLESAEDQKRWGYLAFAMIAIVVLLLGGAGVFLYLRGPTSKNVTAGAVTASVGAPEKYAAGYEAARQALLHGKAAEAAQSFDALASDHSLPKPFAQWCMLQEGVAQLAAGHLTDARTAFSALNDRPLTGAGQLPTFFQEIATLGAGDDPVRPDALAGFDHTSYGALALLVAGLKDWELGNFEDASGFLRQFQSENPSGEFLWVTEYHALAEDYLSDFTDYRGVMAMAKSAKTLPELKNAAATLRKIKDGLKRGDSLLASRIEAKAAEITAAAAEIDKKAAGDLDAEKKALADARTKAITLCRDLKFRDARPVVPAAKLTNPDLLREQRALVQKIDWLNRFKDTLVKDAATGYSGKIKAKNGGEIPGVVSKATDDGIEITPPAAGGAAAKPIVKKWTELAPDSVLTMAMSFIRPEMPPNVTADRRWSAGLFALMTNQKPDAKKLLTEAAKGNSYYTENLPLILNPRRVNLAKGKPVTSSDPEMPGHSDPPAHAVDGDPATRWLSSQPGNRWLRIDLGKEYNIARWMLRNGNTRGDGPETDTTDFTLQRSSDDKTWNDVDPVKNNMMDATDRRVQQFWARYVRLMITKPNRRPNDPTVRIYEMEVHGTDWSGDLVGDLFSGPAAASVPELSSHDIGYDAKDPAGQTSVDDRTGLFNVRASGADIAKDKDAFRFVHRGLRGDGQIVVRLETVDRGTDGTKAGVMMRDGLSPDAKMAFMAASPGAAGTIWVSRKDAKAMATDKTDKTIQAPCWLKLTRVGNVFTGFASKDGAAWKQIGAETIEMGPVVEAGMAVTNRGTGGQGGGKMEITALGGGK